MPCKDRIGAGFDNFQRIFGLNLTGASLCHQFLRVSGWMKKLFSYEGWTDVEEKSAWRWVHNKLLFGCVKNYHIVCSENICRVQFKNYPSSPFRYCLGGEHLERGHFLILCNTFLLRQASRMIAFLPLSCNPANCARFPIKNLVSGPNRQTIQKIMSTTTEHSLVFYFAGAVSTAAAARSRNSRHRRKASV